MQQYTATSEDGKQQHLCTHLVNVQVCNEEELL